MAEYRAGPRKRKPTHPGRIIAGELEALALTPYAAAPLLGISKQALGNIIAERSAVSPEMALRLGKFFGNGPELWMGLQTDIDLWESRAKLGDDLAKIATAARGPVTERKSREPTRLPTRETNRPPTRLPTRR
jgi:antitoxin HigA-1